MAQEFHIEFAPRTAVHVEDAEPLGAVQVLVERVVGSPSQAQVNAAVAQYITDHPGVISGISEQVKQALLQLAAKVAYIDDDGQDYYDNLYDALYPAATLVGITATYTQTGTVYDTASLDDLKSDLVVTGNWSDGGTTTISTGYTLSGTLEAGTSTVTVTYSGFTDTFTVTVTATQTLLYTIDGDLLQAKSLGFSAPNYGSSSTTRLSYMPFDLVIEYGKTYRIIAESDVSTADMSVHVYNETAYNNAQNSQNITNSNVSYTWKGTMDWTYTAGNINSKPAKCFRLSFRYSTSDPTITSNFVDVIKIYEVLV